MEKGLKILSWAEEDRPREKLLLKGRTNLSDAELIAILIGSGSSELSAVELSKKILSSVSNNLNALAKLSVKDLTQFKGIGEAKAIAIVSALEIGRRRNQSAPVERVKITGSKTAYDLIRPDLIDQPIEQFWVLMLARNNTVLHKRCVSTGGVSGTVADPKIIFKKALEDLASGVILIHNHPSGNLKPSQADIKLTNKLSEAGKLLEIPVIDHIIFTEHGYYSFADEGML
ncbi:RadC family protein [Roseivirga pacifica]|uniref:RadC family protein n=1 Tax=Roseivirga pacifica TaxID=1267423 RepID=UPI0020958564|nr:DNA repair protein RadC [Roseivirga pacifica]MCO6359911.1 DNA repair protein RadC [Roseivirga pacifica]MCO6367281.1 DNA repair protein RadC [Roseivirga pacifica]MCO6370187.1 DNA repair protein RadC [Roseivirga pacifica]MCO6374938.1 DNA repair protein RadC [Roseivirga pacifica]MCO6380196.1 DNA repair protein RadC [Roseivirga pacifica]